MKEQYDALVARADEFAAFAVGYEGPEAVEWTSRINQVVSDLAELQDDVNNS